MPVRLRRVLRTLALEYPAEGQKKVTDIYVSFDFAPLDRNGASLPRFIAPYCSLRLIAWQFVPAGHADL
ncbi:hypothetical protein [Actibacterium sp. 188UL27-1]|uniref:hypothetical protein n=1 Tax=Actibacterium sp. 188UL27-1 TaxID=2786961 RepID=UPI00195ED345|nr:hypothetical protein [Actibacterium sp. 188UL27-1]MBM7066154.1 hypothetical protein [Actibacterium sp. 188UL27-1]